MFKRVRWMAMGAVAGSAATVWAQVRVRRAVARATPDQLGTAAAAKARAWRAEVGAALEEGRAAMEQREAELRARYLRPAGPAASRPRPRPRPAPALPPGRSHLHVVGDGQAAHPAGADRRSAPEG